MRNDLPLAALLILSYVAWCGTPAARAQEAGKQKAQPQQVESAPEAAAPQADPVAADVARLLADLESEDPPVRELAAVRLKNQSGHALDAVEKALRQPDVDPAARPALEAALPYLRARARANKRMRDDWDVNLRTSVAAYEKAGKRSEKWDAAVRDAISLYTQPVALRDRGETDETVAAAFKKATDAGCDDPYVLYLATRAQLRLDDVDRLATLRRMFDQVLAMAETQYPPNRKAFAAVRFVQESRARDQRPGPIISANLPEALAGKDEHWTQTLEIADAAFDALTVLKGDTQAAFEEVYEAYRKARPADDPGPHVFKGSRYVHYAWEARGGGYADTVTGEGWKLFNDRLSEADRELTRAWELDPTHPRAPTTMLVVEKGLRGDRDEMEKWFRRAMDANPDNYDACSQKLEFLLPRWHGSHRDMIAFGRECVAEQNWWANLPHVLIDAHEKVSREVPLRKVYLANPAVWRDIRSVYVSFPRVYPDSPQVQWHRSQLAKWACECQQWDEAIKAFEAVGEEPDYRIFRSKALYDYWRRKAKKNAGQAPPAAPDEPEGQQVRLGAPVEGPHDSRS